MAFPFNLKQSGLAWLQRSRFYPAMAGVHAGALQGRDASARALALSLPAMAFAALAFAGRLFIILLVFIGLGIFYDEAVGDGPLPRLQSLRRLAPADRQQVWVNTSANLPENASDAQRWQALRKGRKLLGMLSPELEAWLVELHARKRIVYGPPPSIELVGHHFSGESPVDSAASPLDDVSLQAAYRNFTGRLYLPRDFWDLSDGEKACVLAHEYRHARQNLPKQMARQLAKVLSGRMHEYGSTIEDEAFLYERRAYRALGMPDNGISYYLKARSLE